MESELISKVEAAIRNAIFEQFGSLHCDGDCRAAIAAIKAMLEPTETMILDGARAAVDQHCYKYNAWDRCVDSDEHRERLLNGAKHGYAAMLGVALGERFHPEALAEQKTEAA